MTKIYKKKKVMQAGYFENDFHHATNNIAIGDSGLLSGYLYTNVTQEDPTINLVLTIINHKNRSNNGKTNFPILNYQSNRRITPLNDWNNLKYFTASFFTFFFFGIEGHLSTTNELKKEKMLLEAQGKWELLYYLKRLDNSI